MALSRVTRPWLWSDFIFYRTETGRRFTEAKDIMHKFTIDVILERKAAWEKQLSSNDMTAKNAAKVAADSSEDHDKPAQDNITFDDLRNSTFFSSGNKRLAFLDLLLHQHLIEHTMSIDDIREEVDTFMFAVSIHCHSLQTSLNSRNTDFSYLPPLNQGHDTTAMNISWTLYMLGLHEDIQENVRDELDKVFAEDDIDFFADGDEDLAKQLKITNVTSDQLREMKYLERVIKESLRMWPSIPFVAREMTEDLTVGKFLMDTLKFNL